MKQYGYRQLEYILTSSSNQHFNKYGRIIVIIFAKSIMGVFPGIAIISMVALNTGIIMII
jgi:hypothetical protein